MFKKLLLVASVSALAVIGAPAAAQAGVELTGVEPGELVTAESTDTELTINANSTLDCSVLHLEGMYAGFGSLLLEGGLQGCAVKGTTVVAEVTDLDMEVTLLTGEAGWANSSWLIDIPALGLLWCDLRTVGSLGVEYQSGDDEFSIEGGPLTGSGSFGCPVGAEALHGSFAIRNGSGESVTIHG